MFLKKVSFLTHQNYIFFIKNTVQIVISQNIITI